MITLHRLNGCPIVVNLELIETVEPTPDTMITFTTGRKLVVTESIDDVVLKSMDYKKKLHSFINALDKK